MSVHIIYVYGVGASNEISYQNFHIKLSDEHLSFIKQTTYRKLFTFGKYVFF